jgi:hypothetical protein
MVWFLSFLASRMWRATFRRERNRSLGAGVCFAPAVEGFRIGRDGASETRGMRSPMFRDPSQMLRGIPIATLAVCSIAVGLWLPVDPTLRWPGIDTAQAEQAASAPTVNRERKSDRLALPARKDSKRISTIEIVGVSDVTIIYRDAEGRELFRTNPLSNATITAKDIVLPALTIRDSGTSAAPPVTVDVPTRRDAELPVGCESPFSPYADPKAPKTAGRCVSQAPDARGFAVATLAR